MLQMRRIKYLTRSKNIYEIIDDLSKKIDNEIKELDINQYRAFYHLYNQMRESIEKVRDVYDQIVNQNQQINVNIHENNLEINGLDYGIDFF